MSPSATPPSPQEIHQKLSHHPTPKGGISAMKPAGASKATISGTGAGASTGAGTELDPAIDSVLSPDVFSASSHATQPSGGLIKPSSSLPPLSSIAEHHSGSGEDTEDDDDDDGARTVNLSGQARGSVDECAIKSGYLWKKGERRKTWKKRWFVLRPAHLAYYKTSAEYELLRLLDLADVHSCTQIALKKHENTFGLVSAARTFYLQAKTQVELQEWIKALEDARQALMATSSHTSISGSISVPTVKPRSNSLSAPSLSPSPPRHGTSHLQNITSSDSDEPSPQALHAHPALSRSQPVSVSPTKSHFPASVDPAKTVLSGYLMKCGSKRRNWRKRWFILNGEHLMYTGSHMDTKPHRKFQFSEIIDALEYDLPAHHRHNPILASPTVPATPGAPATDDLEYAHSTHTFKIITTKRTLLVCAPSEEEEIKWLGAVRALIARRSGSGVVPRESGVSAGKSTA